VKYADDLVPLAKEETVLQGMIDRVIEIGRRYGMEMNVEKPKVMRISRQPSPIRIMIDQKQLEIVEYFNYLRSMIANDARCTREIKYIIAMAKATFNKKKNFSQQIGLKSKEETSKVLHLGHIFVWC
jgi:ribulose kinase